MRKLIILAALGLSSCIVLVIPKEYKARLDNRAPSPPVVGRVENCQTCSDGTGGCSIHISVNHVPAEIGSYDPEELGFMDSTQN